MSTLKQDILSELVASFPTELNDNDLATRLSANEPSVRRARKQLQETGMVRIGSYERGNRNDVDYTPRTYIATEAARGVEPAMQPSV